MMMVKQISQEPRWPLEAASLFLKVGPAPW